VGIRSFHTTLCVWGLGDLASVYGVPLGEVTWVTERADPFPVRRTEPWRVEETALGDSLDAAFERGDLDAMLVPRVPSAVRRGSAVPLFKDTGEAMRHYFAHARVFPIMHTVVIREDVLERRPELPGQLTEAFEDSKQVGYSFYEDPNWSRLAEASEVLRSEREWLGEDAYPYGLEANIPALNRLIRYELELGLIAAEPSLTSLFVAP
jgi:4,5-dihydroxyphthalate decarboxylase